jgi:large subunit ribosomal protein L23
MKSPQTVLLRPLQTEKTTAQHAASGIICFEVARGANKIEVRQAVEKLFAVKVREVRIVTMKRKPKTLGRYSGFRPAWRKAYVRLAEGQKVPEFFQGV